MESKGTYKWKPIEDLPKSWPSFVSPRLHNVAEIWKEQRQKLDQSAISQFNEQLKRQWAIETGIIENLYTLDRGITRLLVERGIEASLIPHGTANKPVTHIINLMADQKNVVEGLFDFVASARQLSTSYIKEIHAALTEHQETVDGIDTFGKSVTISFRRGDWKKSPNNPSRPDGSYHEYCPPEHVAPEMDRLIDMHLKHQEQSIPPEIEAAWLHHRFTQIHPFQDGNGRVARALATLVVLRAGWFPLVVVSDDRAKYIHDLEQADFGKLEPLAHFFASLSEAEFLRALKLSEQIVTEKRTYRSMIEAVAERLRIRTRQKIEEHNLALKTADMLCKTAYVVFKKLASDLCETIHQFNPNAIVEATISREATKMWFWDQVVVIARKLDYYADLRRYHNWVRFKIREDRQTEIVVSFHPIGSEFFGVVGASAFIEYRSRNESGSTQLDGPYSLADRAFVFTYKDDEKQTVDSFKRWLNDVILKGIEEWRRQL